MKICYLPLQKLVIKEPLSIVTVNSIFYLSYYFKRILLFFLVRKLFHGLLPKWDNVEPYYFSI